VLCGQVTVFICFTAIAAALLIQREDDTMTINHICPDEHPCKSNISRQMKAREIRDEGIENHCFAIQRHTCRIYID
jgi:hypothetical protein